VKAVNHGQNEADDSGRKIVRLRLLTHCMESACLRELDCLNVFESPALVSPLLTVVVSSIYSDQRPVSQSEIACCNAETTFAMGQSRC
jgi:hypothetical protein